LPGERCRAIAGERWRALFAKDWVSVSCRERGHSRYASAATWYRSPSVLLSPRCHIVLSGASTTPAPWWKACADCPPASLTLTARRHIVLSGAATTPGPWWKECADWLPASLLFTRRVACFKFVSKKHFISRKNIRFISSSSFRTV